ncbi:MAG: hypothetical protein IPL87_03205 [Candidatus Moraniibacteriota bacterium]|nr:MAG: hypothetical protein IPL87_03205 [Candidatus Moranbacteria bacterium]
MNILTPKQKIVLQAIRQFFSEQGKMPTIRELQEESGRLGLRLKSLRSFFVYLSDLEEKGFIQRTREERGIKLKELTSDMFVNIPILGMANAGTALSFADEYVEGYLKVSRKIVRSSKNVFAVQISGTSMNKALVEGKTIEDGDFVLVNGDIKEYKTGDKVLVVIDGLATVKTFRTVDGKNIVLLPESTDPKHKAIFLTDEDDFVLNGKVIDVLKLS